MSISSRKHYCSGAHCSDGSIKTHLIFLWDFWITPRYFKHYGWITTGDVSMLIVSVIRTKYFSSSITENNWLLIMLYLWWISVNRLIILIYSIKSYCPLKQEKGLFWETYPLTVVWNIWRFVCFWKYRNVSKNRSNVKT